MAFRKSQSKKRLVLVDGHAILHRAYHAFPKTLKTRKGELINAVYGFTRMLLKVIEDLKPTYLAVAFDLPKPTFRHHEFIGYQAQRPKMEADLGNQIDRVYQVVRVLNIPIFAVEGFEADDVIGTLASQACLKSKVKSQKSKIGIVIVTGDKDILQLVKPKIRVYVPKKGFSQPVMFNKKKVEKELGIKPEQVVDYKALVGDASDNYPGVSGIGPKTAVKLLREFGSLKGIYRAVREKSGRLEGKVEERLLAGFESAQLSQKLAQIVTNVSVELDLRACRVHDYDEEKARELFEELGFKSLMARLPGMKKSNGKKVTLRTLKGTENTERNKQMKLL